MSNLATVTAQIVRPAPWASVVMPIRKCRATVTKSLDSLLRQKVLGRCEIIFVCDTQDDDSLEVIRKHPLLKQWNFTEIFHPGRGLAQAYNLGWQAARSEYVFNMHSDCYPVDDDAMVRTVAWLEREGALAVQPLNDIPQNDWDTMDFWDRVTSAQFRNAKPAHALMGKFDLFRRSILEKIGGFDEYRFWSAAEDADMVERIWEQGKLASSDVIVIHAHLHPPHARFVSTVRKHTQAGEGAGALFRKYWCSMPFMKRAWLIVGVHVLKLVLLVGILAGIILGFFFHPFWLYPLVPLVLMLSLSAYYARHAMLSRDWRIVLIPFAVATMFAFFAMAMVRAFIRGRQAFDYIKKK